jgi:hypothetical protein
MRAQQAVTWEDLQAQMRRDAEGHLVCERCGGRVTRGWVYSFGAIVLATCSKDACQPTPSPPWTIGCTFSRARRKRQDRT